MVSGRNSNSGGDIQQLLSMLEKSSDEQRKQTLQLIQKDDPAKAALLKARLLTVERVFMLDEESLSRVLEDISEENIANSLRGVDLELRKRTLNFINSHKRKQILDIIKKSSPDEAELESSRRQMISRVRELEHRGSIHLGSLRKVASPTKKAA